MRFEKAWRWFGPKDAVSLAKLKEIGVESVVTSLYHKRAGEVWPIDEILAVKGLVENHAMKFSVVESLPVAEGIKQHTSDYDLLVFNYIKSLENLAACGVSTVCYNFMPVIDWVRTDLDYTLPDGGIVMQYDHIKFAAFDLYILKRENAEREYAEETLALAKELFTKMTEEERKNLAYNIIVLTQGFIGNKYEGDYIGEFKNRIGQYEEIDHTILRNNLAHFLSDIIPYAEKYGIDMAIHPDDPPFSVLGLPRIVSTYDDISWILNQQKTASNGLTFCSGSLSPGESDLYSIAEDFANNIKFLHLRNNKKSESKTFHESGHLNGDVDMKKLVKILVDSENSSIVPYRPDHGIKYPEDNSINHNQGYPFHGRLRGMNEIMDLEKQIFLE